MQTTYDREELKNLEKSVHQIDESIYLDELLDEVCEWVVNLLANDILNQRNSNRRNELVSTT